MPPPPLIAPTPSNVRPPEAPLIVMEVAAWAGDAPVPTMPPAARSRPRSTTVEARVRRNNWPSADTVDSFRRVGGLLRPEPEIRPQDPLTVMRGGCSAWCVSAHNSELSESPAMKWDCREVSGSDGALNSSGLSRVRTPAGSTALAECTHRQTPRHGAARVTTALFVIRVDTACGGDAGCPR
ncbi:hypothetical protein SBRY_100035 [Actinacidiphila bryophytorum]|uniref:Uncharacterized protein n=1 Tax=Actinacidiphila bryophytorum TaxID=1436133 RepID=A0A9W4GY36_9ACTN|nr:hypothetical protein SBRY_100035 [Actinacidiphila bryophytorum]